MAAIAETLSALRQAILAKPRDPKWVEKMLHPVPEAPTILKRAVYLVAKAKGEVVLDLGCTGEISAAIRQVAKGYYGVDRVAAPSTVIVDLDRTPEQLPVYPGVTLILASELLEHLANPGRCLEAIAKAYPQTPIYLSVPQAGAYQMLDGCEMVHAEHVAWYSYTTLMTLLARVGYRVLDWRWYHGQPPTAEGVIVKALTS
jgi:hypothetical protein